MKVLFVCNQNINRSKTAEEIFKGKFQTRSVGLYNDKPLNEEQLGWADIVMVMEGEQRTEISRRFPKLYLQKKILSLNVPDIYYHNQPELISVLKERMDEIEDSF